MSEFALLNKGQTPMAPLGDLSRYARHRTRRRPIKQTGPGRATPAIGPLATSLPRRAKGIQGSEQFQRQREDECRVLLFCNLGHRLKHA